LRGQFVESVFCNYWIVFRFCRMCSAYIHMYIKYIMYICTYICTYSALWTLNFESKSRVSR
jgi:hypothetical protein